MAQRIRQLGLKRIVFGSDLADPNGSARWYWEQVHKLIPLSRAELETIASNVTPYLSATPR